MWKIILFVQLFATIALTGVIWLVQIVHYPLFAFVGDEKYKIFHVSHMNWISFVVAPLMIAEALTAILIVFYQPPNANSLVLWFGLILVASIWASTFFLQVPLHERLALGFDAETHHALVSTNWIRTAAWTIRSGICLWLLWKM
jgi:hypothetical protein